MARLVVPGLPAKDLIDIQVVVAGNSPLGARWVPSVTGCGPRPVTGTNTPPRELAARPDHDVNDYSDGKMPWISAGLARAET